MTAKEELQMYLDARSDAVARYSDRLTLSLELGHLRRQLSGRCYLAWFALLSAENLITCLEPPTAAERQALDRLSMTHPEAYCEWRERLHERNVEHIARRFLELYEGLNFPRIPEPSQKPRG